MHPSNFFTYISNSIPGGFPGLPDKKQNLSPDFNAERTGTGTGSEGIPGITLAPGGILSSFGTSSSDERQGK
ncbi:hypothetical protein ACX0G9_01630 [Flavitalea flava]